MVGSGLHINFHWNVHSLNILILVSHANSWINNALNYWKCDVSGNNLEFNAILSDKSLIHIENDNSSKIESWRNLASISISNIDLWGILAVQYDYSVRTKCHRWYKVLDKSRNIPFTCIIEWFVNLVSNGYKPLTNESPLLKVFSWKNSNLSKNIPNRQ